MWRLWYFRSVYSEGWAWLAELLALPGAAQATGRPIAIISAADPAYCQGDLAATRDLPEVIAEVRSRGNDAR